MSKKNVYNPEFKSKVILELLSGQAALNELAEKYQIAPATLSNWNKQFQERAAPAPRPFIVSRIVSLGRTGQNNC